MANGVKELRNYGSKELRRSEIELDVVPPASGGSGLLLSDIAREVFADEVEAARRTGNLGYMARVLAQVTLPHSKPEGNEYVRRNGRLTLAVLSPSRQS